MAARKKRATTPKNQPGALPSGVSLLGLYKAGPSTLLLGRYERTGNVGAWIVGTNGALLPCSTGAPSKNPKTVLAAAKAFVAAVRAKS